MNDEQDQKRNVSLVPRREFTLLPSSLGEARQIAELIANSDFAPRDYKDKPANVLIAIQMGADIGLKPMQALQNIAIINGKPSIYGDAALALVMPDLVDFSESFEGTWPNDDFSAVCVAKRKGWESATKRTFSIGDAKAAKLWGKTSSTGQPTPWVTYPKRMLQMRARGFTLRDVGADRLLGLVLAEEAQDYPSIDAQVISSEVVTRDPLEGVSDELKASVTKGFETLAMSQAQALVQVNKFFTPEKSKDDAAKDLLEWLKDEFARRKSGKPRVKKDGDNGKKTAPAPDSAGSTGEPAAGSVVSGTPSEPAKPTVESVAPVAEGKPVAEKPAKDELF